MANTSILAAFERMWQHIVIALGNKADITDVTNAINNIEHPIYTAEESVDTSVEVINADTLGGFLPSAFATESFVTNKIAEAQLSGGGSGGNIDLSGYAEKSDVDALKNLVGTTNVSTQITRAINGIDYPVDSVNGKTGAVTLSASDISAVPTTRTINSKALSSNITLSASDVSAAPTGYGLGEAVQFSISEVNSITRPGWYYCSDNGKIGSHTSSRWWMHVKAYGAGDAFASQEMYSFTGSKCLKFERHKINGTWGAWASVDSMTRVKLWENASLESTFDAQKIALDLSGYDGVEVVTYADQTTGVYLNSGFIRKGLQGVFQYMYATQAYRLTRTFTVSDTGVEFATATNTGTLAVNKLAKPFIIYGVKGVIE